MSIHQRHIHETRFPRSPVSFDLIDDDEKVCGCCEESWPLTTEFWHRRTGSPDGLFSICKACVQEKKVAKKKEPQQAKQPTQLKKVGQAKQPKPEVEGERQCLICGVTKTLNKDNFHHHSHRKNGFAAQCKLCSNARHKERRALKPGEVLPRRISLLKPLPTATKKACNRCHEEYDLTPEFWYRKAKASDGFATQCKLCEKSLQSVRRPWIKA